MRNSRHGNEANELDGSLIPLIVSGTGKPVEANIIVARSGD